MNDCFEFWLFGIVFQKVQPAAYLLKLCHLNSQPSSSMIVIMGKKKKGTEEENECNSQLHVFFLFKLAVVLSSVTTQTAFPALCFLVSNSCASLALPTFQRHCNPVGFSLVRKYTEETGWKVATGTSLHVRERQTKPNQTKNKENWNTAAVNMLASLITLIVSKQFKHITAF